MNYYVIKKNRKDYELEKFSESVWENVKDKLDKNNIVHITNDLSDPKIQYYELKEIIWGRVFNKCSCNYRKIYIPLSTDIEQMEKEFQVISKKIEEELDLEYEENCKRKQEKYKKSKERNEEHNRPLIEQFNKLIPVDSDKDTALKLWKQYDFLVPPPDIISKYKSETNMTWTQFAHFVRTNY